MSPTGWTTAKLPDLIGKDGLYADGDWVESKDQDPSGDVRLTQLADVGVGEWRDRSNRFMTAAKQGIPTSVRYFWVSPYSTSTDSRRSRDSLRCL